MYPRRGSLGSASGTTCAAVRAQLLLFYLLFAAIALVLLSPIAAWLFSRFVASSGHRAVGNFDIAVFLLSPSRLAFALVATSLYMAISCLRMGGMLVIGYAAGEGRQLVFSQPLRFVLRRIVGVVALSLVILASLVVVLIPFLAVAGLAIRSLLSEHDINYYLESRPLEFWCAAGLGCAMGLIAAALMATVLLRVVFSLPNLLLLRLRVLPAVLHSWRQTRGRWVRIFVALLVWFLGWTLIFGLVNWGLQASGEWLVELTARRTRLLVLTLGVIATVSLTVNFILSFLNEATACLLIARLYREAAGGSAKLLPAAEQGSALREHRVVEAVVRPPLGVVVAGLALMALVVHNLLEKVQWEDRVEISAHRGSSLVAPENTLSAVRQAVQDGATYVEVDVQRTADNVLVIAHDADLMRVAGQPIVISQTAYRDLVQVDIGSRRGPGFAHERVPTLEQVIAEVRGRAKLIVELKSYRGDKEQLVREVVRTLREQRLTDAAVVMSLQYDELLQMSRLAPEITVGFATSASLGDITGLDVDFLAVSRSQATDLLISSAHARGKQIYVWTIDDEIAASVMIDRGVDNLISNDPARIVRVLQDRQELSNIERILLRFRGLYLD